MRKLIWERFRLLGWGGGYLALFLWVYAHRIVPTFAYQGFVYRPSFLRTLIITILVLSPLLWMPLTINRPSLLTLWMLYFAVYTPAVVVSFHVLNLALPFPTFFGWLWASLLFLAFLAAVPHVRIPKIRLASGKLIWGLMTLWIIGYGLFFHGFGFHGLPSLQRIYKVRLAARDIISSQSRLFGYLLRWFTNVINPFFVILGLQRRRWGLLLLGLVGQIFVFTFDATKTTLISIPYLAGLYVLLRWKREHISAKLLFQGSIVVFLGSLMTDYLLHSKILTTYGLRRVFYVPGLLTAYYFDYFSVHPQWHWAHTAIGRFFAMLPPSGVSAPGPGFLIGEVYFHNPAGNANVHLWADAFANMGIPGMLVITMGLFFLLWLYDSLSCCQDHELAFLLTALPGFALTNTSLLTALLTHGWLLALLLLWLWPLPSRQPDSPIFPQAPHPLRKLSRST